MEDELTKHIKKEKRDMELAWELSELDRSKMKPDDRDYAEDRLRGLINAFKELGKEINRIIEEPKDLKWP